MSSSASGRNGIATREGKATGLLFLTTVSGGRVYQVIGKLSAGLMQKVNTFRMATPELRCEAIDKPKPPCRAEWQCWTGYLELPLCLPVSTRGDRPQFDGAVDPGRRQRPPVATDRHATHRPHCP